MSEETRKSQSGWTGLVSNLQHFDPFEGLSEGISEEELKNVRYGFRISGQNLLLDKTSPCEVIRHGEIFPVPNTPDWLSGLINLRGNLIPVINLGNKTGTPDRNFHAVRDRKALLVIDENEDIISTYLDELPVTLQIVEETAETTDDFEAAPELFRTHIKKAYKIDDTIWYEIDHRSLFSQLAAGISVHDEASQQEGESAVL